MRLDGLQGRGILARVGEGCGTKYTSEEEATHDELVTTHHGVPCVVLVLVARHSANTTQTLQHPSQSARKGECYEVKKSEPEHSLFHGARKRAAN